MRLCSGLALVLLLFAAVDCVEAQDFCPPDVVWSELTGLAPGIYTAWVWGAYGCMDTPCGSTVFTVPEPPPGARAAKATSSMVSSMSDCGGWPLFADDFESGSTSAWDETEH